MLVFGGVYGNLQAFEALMAEARRLGLSSAQMICTGDLVAYCGDPSEVVDAFRQSGIETIQGNCEDSLAQGSDDCGCGFDDGTACSLLSAQWYAFCRAELRQDQTEWMASLPRSITVTLGSHTFRVVHGTTSSINEFVFPSVDEAHLAGQFTSEDFDHVLAGHSGIPFHRRVGARSWINSGALGMPANDGTPRVWYALITVKETGTVDVTFHGLDYDYQGAAATMKAKGLVNGYADCLKSGLWPSLDVLPQAEQALTGQPLTF